MPDLTLINRPVVLSAGTSAATLTDILANIEGIVGRAALYGVDDLVFAKLFASDSIEAVFRTSYYRDGFVQAAIPSFLDDWSFGRVGAGTAMSDAGWIEDFATGVPRITTKGLLIEAAAAQLFKYYGPTAANLDTASNVTDATEPSTVPRAGLNWIALNNTAVNTAVAYQNATLTPGSSYTVSVMVETPDSSPPIPVNDSSGGDFRFVLGGDFPNLAFTVEPMRGRVWRVIGSGTLASAPGSVNGIARQPGHSLQAARALKFSGFQLEAGDRASSPILSTGAQATRGEDVARFGFQPTNAFTLFAEADLDEFDGAFQTLICLTGSDITNRITLGRTNDALATVHSVSDDVQVVTNGASIPGSRRVRAAVTVRDTSLSCCWNGGTILTATVPRPIGLSRLWLGSIAGGGNTELNGYLRRVMVLDRPMTDEQLQAMTTL